MIIENIKKFIFPNRCIICDEVLPFGHSSENDFICNECKNKIEFISEPTCKKCGAKINETTKSLCERCERTYESHKSYYDYGFGLCRYNQYVKDSLHNIKYNNRSEYLKFYSKCIAKLYHDKINQMNIECFIPVPIHKNRLILRSYNQSNLLAKYISNDLIKYNINIPVDDNIITRQKNTKVLNKLDDNNRKIELKNAFFVNENNYKSVCIVDDIYTTGTTIEAISKVLRQSGINNIYFIAIAVVDNL